MLKRAFGRKKKSNEEEEEQEEEESSVDTALPDIEVVQLIKAAGRPVTLRFARYSSGGNGDGIGEAKAPSPGLSA
jgi:hypothetical protein